jgi:hypothetical protein
MQYRTMTYMTVTLNNAVFTRKGMHHAGILNIGTSFHDNAAKIASQRSIGADITPCPNNDIADQYGRFMYVRFRMYNWRDSFKTVDGHMPKHL